MQSSKTKPNAVSGLRSIAGSVRRRIRTIIDGSMHPGRRGKVLETLHQMEPPRHILVLCLGNVCRSPFAEYRIRGLMADRELAVEVSSAGFIGPNRTPPGGALRAADRLGIDSADHRSRLVDQQMLGEADLIILVDDAHRRRIGADAFPSSKVVVVLGDLDPAPIVQRTIPDPWGKRADLYDHVFQRIDRCLDELVHAIPWPGDAPDGPRTQSNSHVGLVL